MAKLPAVILVGCLAVLSGFAQPSPASSNSLPEASSAINSVGIELLRQTSRADANALLSPYSIETALSMAYAGADGETRDEMARVLHLNGGAEQVANEFGALQKSIADIIHMSAVNPPSMAKRGETNEPIALDIANRLFGQEGYDFRAAFLDLLRTKYEAPFEALDFKANAAGAAKTINDWVEQQTKQKIRDLIPAGALNRHTGLVLVNAIYFKAPWADPFEENSTAPRPFHPRDGAEVNVPTMSIQKTFGYARTNGLTIVSIPYIGRELQMLIILPDDVSGLAKAEAGLTAAQLESWARLPMQEVKLYLPKFKMQPPTLALTDALKKLGMKSAFDVPPGSANFDRIAPRRPNDYLYISDVFHKTFISVDEKGTEAAAATAVVMMHALALRQPISGPVEVRVDHPFIFAIQHRASGACLFLGHVVDPR